MIPGLARAIALTLVSWVVELFGLLVVWFALPYKRVQGEAQPFTQFPGRGYWQLVRLPAWALLWDNPYDGVRGDKRGWWANYCVETYGEPNTTRLSMWRWAALRNPANYFSRVICGVDVSTLRIVAVAGSEAIADHRGGYLLKGMAAGGRVYPRLYAEWRITATHGLMLDLGWKIKTSHNGTAPDAPEKDRLKGIVAVVSPWKGLA